MKISPAIQFVGNPTHTFTVDSDTGKATLKSGADSGEVTYIHTLVLNALAFSVAGSSINRRKNSDGNYYTITFPDDFVYEINSTESLSSVLGGSTADGTTTAAVPKDPFVGYRSADAPYQIDVPLDVTITIPQGMAIGTNTHAQFTSPYNVDRRVMNDNGERLNFKTSEPDGTDRASGSLTYREASADPCINIDFDSPKVTATTIQNTILTVDNYGNTIGGGGYGGAGGMLDYAKGRNQRGGGGGGGGMGLHQSIVAGSKHPHHHGSEFSYNHFANVSQYYAEINELHPDIKPTLTEGEDTPLPGQGGLAWWFWPYVVNGVQGGAANGGFASLASAGAGGAGTGSGADHATGLTGPASYLKVTQVNLSATRGGYGGNVVYFKSNVHGTYTGTTVKLINRSTGYMRGGAGGGGGGVEGSAGAAGGSFYDGSGSYNTAAGSALGSDANGFGGLEGHLMFWDTANVAIANTYTNERSDNNWMQGRDIKVT